MAYDLSELSLKRVFLALSHTDLRNPHFEINHPFLVA